MKYVILNLTGTLCDIRGLVWKAHNEYLSINGINIENREIKSIVGLSLADQINILEKKYKVKLDYDEMSNYSKIRQKVLLSKLKIDTKKVNDVLKQIRSKNLKIIISSNNILENVEFYLNKFKIDKTLFYKINSVEDIGVNEDKISIILKKYNIDSKECVYVDDSIKGISLAKSSGLYTVGLIKRNTKNELIDGGANKVIKNLSEILKILK
jgi:beta-phosphoglucomutase-like phosphatase (HAD superfamily)